MLVLSMAVFLVVALCARHLGSLEKATLLFGFIAFVLVVSLTALMSVPALANTVGDALFWSMPVIVCFLLLNAFAGLICGMIGLRRPDVDRRRLVIGTMLSGVSLVLPVVLFVFRI